MLWQPPRHFTSISSWQGPSTCSPQQHMLTSSAYYLRVNVVFALVIVPLTRSFQDANYTGEMSRTVQEPVFSFRWSHKGIRLCAWMVQDYGLLRQKLVGPASLTSGHSTTVWQHPCSTAVQCHLSSVSHVAQNKAVSLHHFCSRSSLPWYFTSCCCALITILWQWDMDTVPASHREISTCIVYAVYTTSMAG